MSLDMCGVDGGKQHKHVINGQIVELPNYFPTIEQMPHKIRFWESGTPIAIATATGNDSHFN